jgi:TM2 domain-containing membrane protein YozV
MLTVRHMTNQLITMWWIFVMHVREPIMAVWLPSMGAGCTCLNCGIKQVVYHSCVSWLGLVIVALRS